MALHSLYTPALAGVTYLQSYILLSRFLTNLFAWSSILLDLCLSFTLSSWLLLCFVD